MAIITDFIGGIKYSLVPKFDRTEHQMFHILNIMKAFWQVTDTNPEVARIYKNVDTSLVAKWINENQISLNDFSISMKGNSLSEEDTKTLIPFLTYVHLSRFKSLKIPLENLNEKMHSYAPIELTPSDADRLKRFTDLQALKLQLNSLIADEGVTPKMSEHLRSIAKLTQLTSLDIESQKKISYTRFKLLSALTKLQFLALQKINYIDIYLKSFTCLTNLTSFSYTPSLIQETKLRDSGVKCLSPLTNLTSLTLNQCQDVTDIGIASINNLTNLTLLNCNDCSITDHVWRHLIQFTKLTNLSIFSKEIKTMNFLSYLTNLQILTPPICDDSMCKPLKELTSLKWLYLSTSSDSNQPLKSIQKLTNLTHLHFQFFYSTRRFIEPFDFERLAFLKNLRHLDLSSCNIDLSNIRSFSCLTNLAKLRISFADKIGPEIEPILLKYSNLKIINIENCKNDPDNNYKGYAFNKHWDNLS